MIKLLFKKINIYAPAYNRPKRFFYHSCMAQSGKGAVNLFILLSKTLEYLFIISFINLCWYFFIIIRPLSVADELRSQGAPMLSQLDSVLIYSCHRIRL